MPDREPSTTVTEADKGKTVNICQNDLGRIKLKENPTTGYRWAIDEINEEVLELEGSVFAMAPDAGIGGGGEQTFTFKARKIGTTRVELKLWREWEGEESIIDRFDVTIQVLDCR